MIESFHRVCHRFSRGTAFSFHQKIQPAASSRLAFPIEDLLARRGARVGAPLWQREIIDCVLYIHIIKLFAFLSANVSRLLWCTLFFHVYTGKGHGSRVTYLAVYAFNVLQSERAFRKSPERSGEGGGREDEKSKCRGWAIGGCSNDGNSTSLVSPRINISGVVARRRAPRRAAPVAMASEGRRNFLW